MNAVILGDGLLGHELIQRTGWQYISRKKDGIDFNNLKSWEEQLTPYDTIVNCIAYTKTYDNTKQLSWDTNYKAVSELADYCLQHNKKLVHISTDHVYANNLTGNVSEESVPVHLETWYGYTKLLADAYIELKLEDYLIIRTSHKPYPFPYKLAWDDQKTNGDYVTVISDLIQRLVVRSATGIFNVGTKTKTWYELTKDEFNTLPTQRVPGAPLIVTMDLQKQNSFLGLD